MQCFERAEELHSERFNCRRQISVAEPSSVIGKESLGVDMKSMRFFAGEFVSRSVERC